LQLNEGLSRISATDMLAAAFPAMHHEHMGEIRNMGVKKVHSNDMSDICFIGNAFWNRVALFDTIAPYLVTKRTLIWWLDPD